MEQAIKTFISGLIENSIENKELAEVTAEYLARDIANLNALLTAAGSEEERLEAITFALYAIAEKLENAGLLPNLGEIKAEVIGIVASQLMSANAKKVIM